MQATSLRVASAWQARLPPQFFADVLKAENLACDRSFG
jgi:hypothetical protein